MAEQLWVLAIKRLALSKSLHYDCFSAPRSKWVPVGVEMVFVIILSWCTTYNLHIMLHIPEGVDLRVRVEVDHRKLT